MPKVRNAPYWLDRFPTQRRPTYPVYRGDSATRVVVVGGGLIGCACALSFAGAGIQTMLLEAERVGGGAMAGGAGLVAGEFDASFQNTAALHGLRAARILWHGMRRASLDFSAALRRMDVRCDLAVEDVLWVARHEDDVRRLRKEQQARKEAGLGQSWMTRPAVRSATGTESDGGVRSRGASLDPYRAAIGLASAAAERGALIFERSAVRRVRAGRKRAEVVTARGRVQADAVVIATDAPILDLKALRRHLKAEHSYGVVTAPLGATVRREVGPRGAALRDSSVPPHVLRWLKDDRVLFLGGDQAPVVERLRGNALVQRTGQLMYELSTLYPAVSGTQAEWAWDVSRYRTSDGLPCLGAHRNFPRHLFAMGGAVHGPGAAWLAARVLVRLFQQDAVKGDELFGFGRIL
ncbi:MAG: FAD-binding oxidoreductase [Acidobacteria bacterium]|nr:FAD-binding oxidoreductase [Acidobacteriota bacterium]